jgi:hypothetical protein
MWQGYSRHNLNGEKTATRTSRSISWEQLSRMDDTTCLGVHALRFSQRFWDVTKCTSLKVNRRFGGTCRLRLRGRRIRQARIKMGLLGLLFDTEDAGDMIIRNVDRLSMDNTVVYPRRLFLLSRVSKLSNMCLRERERQRETERAKVKKWQQIGWKGMTLEKEETFYLRGGGGVEKSILSLKGSEASPAGTSDKGSMKGKTLWCLEEVAWDRGREIWFSELLARR